MTTAVAQIAPIDLLFAVIPVLAVVVILHVWSRDSRATLIGLGRMLLQLTVIGYFLVYIFDSKHPGVILGILAIMVLVASWIALRASSAPKTRLYPLALAAIFAGGGSVLVLISQAVLALDPWYSPRYLVPLAGMIFDASMNSVSLAAERFEAELGHGASYKKARSTALRSALIPITNSLYAVGLVSLPGMMTGQILSGTSPLIAARYQIMVMCMMFAAAGLSASLFLHLLKPRLALFADDQKEKAGD